MRKPFTKIKNPDRLRTSIMKTGLTYAEVATKAGITQAYLSMVLGGHRLNHNTAHKIAKVVGGQFDDYFQILIPANSRGEENAR